MKATRRLVIIAQATSGGLWEAAKWDAGIAATDGHEVLVLAPSRGCPVSPPDGVKYVDFDVPQGAGDVLGMVRAWFALRVLLHRGDVVHIHGLRGLVLVIPHWPLIVTFHGATKPCGGAFRRIAEAVLLKMVPRITAGAFSVIPMKGWSLAWYPREHSDDLVRRRVHCGSPRLLWFSRVSSQKNFAMFLELVSVAKELQLICGASVAGSFDESMLALREAAVSAGIELLGHVDDSAALLGGDWVSVLLSVFEGRPFAVEECLAAGLPVIVSDLPGNRMMVADDRFLVRDLNEAVRALRLLQSPAERRSVGEKMKSSMVNARAGASYSTRIARIYDAYLEEC